MHDQHSRESSFLPSLLKPMRPLHTGMFDAGAQGPVPVTVSVDRVDRRLATRQLAATSERAGAVAGSHSADVDNIAAFLAQNSSIWQHGAEKVFGAMSHTATAFALSKQTEIAQEEDGGSTVGVGGEGNLSRDVQLRERIEGKIGAKWMRKVFRYKGEEAGASDEVLNELLGHAAAQQRARDDAFGHSAASVKCIEHMLKDMSEQFVASMNTFGSKQLDGMSLQHLIGPFAKDLEAIEQKIGLADEEQDRMTGEALALDEMFAVVSEIVTF
jgi:hypothetical protein